jgi:hypothetical protein
MVGLLLLSFSTGCSPEIAAAADIKIDGGPTIKVQYDGPQEIQINISKAEFADFQLKVVGTLKNVSDYNVSFGEVKYLLDGKQGGFKDGTELSPGEVFSIGTSLAGVNEGSKVLTIKIADPVVEKPEPTVTNKPTVTSKPIETTTPNVEEDNTFFEPIKNPKTPEEIVVTLYFLIDSGKFDEIDKFFTTEGLEFVEQHGGWETCWKDWKEEEGYNKLVKIKIESVAENGGRWKICYRYYFSTNDGLEGTSSENDFVQENGKFLIIY